MKILERAPLGASLAAVVAPVLALVLAMGAGDVRAVNLYKWVDEDGNVTYQDTPPPDNVEFEEQEFGEDDPQRQNNLEVSSQLSDAVEASPVRFYSIPNCDACDLVRLFLETSLVPFTEIDIQDNLTAQGELSDLTGELRVPTIAVGDTVVDGYSKSAMRDALAENGYPISELESGEVELVTADGETLDGGDAVTNLTDEQLENLGNAFENGGEGQPEDSIEASGEGSDQ